MLKCNWFVGGHNLDSSLKLKIKDDFLTSISSSPQKYFQSTFNFAWNLSKIILDKPSHCKILLISASILVGLSINDVTALNVRTANVIQANPPYLIDNGLINTEEAETLLGLTLSDGTVNEGIDDKSDTDDQLEDPSESDDDQIIETMPLSGSSHLIKSIN
ncbi:hypothetical protein J3U08_06850 [Gilliamella sp. B2894]|uniref:hypothetical protein n=1 Tax=unclassified Gilliamella TaxID=2685620 RepID=UPI002269DBBA|nr:MULTISPECIES: hypothetical protein [unclassified Gilliamella]MCX8656505.1 hypothetical protein [Gilliamella sp. B2894]MCX8692940.1 hypothetical protein [Gilliamella sp. B2881]MCX8696275.1 hypothetical protein [Gilliamella sp. B2828]